MSRDRRLYSSMAVVGRMVISVLPVLNPALSYAEKGYVCITTNYRLTTRERWRIDHCIADVKNAVRWLRANAEKYNIDPTRIGATGNLELTCLSCLAYARRKLA